MKIDPKLKEDLKHYLEQKLEHEKNIVTVLSPYKLSDDEIASLKKVIPQLHNAELKNEVQSSILGGVIIKFKSKMINLTLNHELQNLKQLLYATT